MSKKISNLELVETDNIRKSLMRLNEMGWRRRWKRALFHAIQMTGVAQNDEELTRLRIALELP
jgi:hypothetical protein